MWLLAVIPTVFVMGPLALLGAVFPALFAVFQRRWLALLSIISINSTLYLTYLLFRGQVKDHWWGHEGSVWGLAALLALIGAAWSRRRYFAAAAGDAGAALPGPGETCVLLALSVAGGVMVLWCIAGAKLAASPWRELGILWTVAVVGAGYATWVRWNRKGLDRAKGAPATEFVMLSALALACAGVGAASFRPVTPAGARVVWTFEAPDIGSFDASPATDGERLYVAAAHRSGFQSFGAVYGLNPHTGVQLWRFDDGGAMRPVFSSPRVVDGKVYVGEGHHQDSGCRLFCLDAATGTKLWEFATKSHVESTPCVCGGKVYFGAGDDGVYCLSAATGQKLWQFKGPHVDASPEVAGDRLYAGCVYGSAEVFCLDVADGKPVWRRPLDLPSFGTPTAVGDHVYFGIGNGNLLASADKPAGALLCVEAATGKVRWRHDLPDAVHSKPCVGAAVWFGCRDGRVYCLDSADGKPLWSHDLGSPIIAGAIITSDHPVFYSPRTALYAIATAGRLCCLNPSNGKLEWAWDMAAHGPGRPEVLSSPLLQAERATDHFTRRLIFGAGISDLVGSTARLYCLEEPGQK